MKDNVYFYKVLVGRKIGQGVLNFRGTHREAFNFLLVSVSVDFGVDEGQIEVEIFNYMGEA